MGKLATAIAAFAALFVSAAAAEDWPQWLGPRGDNIVRGETLPEKWPDGGPKKVWTAKVGMGYASPIARDGRIYAFTMSDGPKETLAAYDAGSGKELWSQSSPGGYNNMGSWRNYRGTRATPTIEGDRIYTYGGSADLMARELETGKELWHLNVIKETKAKELEFGTSSSPVIVGELIYVQGGAGDGAPVAVAVDKKSGKIAWQSEAKGASKGTKQFPAGGGYATAIAIDAGGTKQIVVFGGLALVGMDPATGKTLWSEPYPTEWDINAATPLYHDGRLFVVSDAGGSMFQVSANSAKKEWGPERRLRDKYQPPILDRGHVYANLVGRLACIEWPKKTIKWSASDVPLEDGGSLLRIGDNMLCMSAKGTLTYAHVTPEKDELKVLSQYEVFPDGQYVWATPLVYKGKIYCRGMDQLVCLDPSGK